MADLALAHERVEGAEGLLEGRRRVVGVGVVEVDAVGPEAAERVLGGRPDRLRREVVQARELADLRRDDDPVAVAPRGHPAAEDRLRLAPRVARHPGGVDVGGVDEVAAGGRVGVEHREGLRLVDRPAEDVAAEAEREDVEVRGADAIHDSG